MGRALLRLGLLAVFLLFDVALLAEPELERTVIRLDPSLDAVVAIDATMECLADGFGFTEGPVWVPQGRSGYLLFSDLPGNVIYKLELGHAKAAVYLFNAVYRWHDGQLTLLIHDMPRTNGLAFSPDERFLYVNGSTDNYVRRYVVRADGTLGEWTLLIDLRNQREPGVTDGMKVDTHGNLYETGPGGIWIISPQGKPLGTIHAPEKAINLAFGEADRKTLLIAAHTGIYRIRLRVPGLERGAVRFDPLNAHKAGRGTIAKPNAKSPSGFSIGVKYRNGLAMRRQNGRVTYERRYYRNYFGSSRKNWLVF